MDLNSLKKAYLIGIKGVGMTSIAQILKAHGVAVSGSDIDEHFFTQEVLAKLGIPFTEYFDAKNIPSDADVIIYSTAYNEANNEEIRAAKESGKWMMSYPQFLGELTKQKFSIAVCGTHGKTTTSAILAHILKEAGKDPSAVIGSRVKNWDGGALDGTGKFFVFEADEYQNKLASYHPSAVILTSVEYDHPDFFPTESDYRKAFEDFIAKIPAQGTLIAWGDDANVMAVLQQARCNTQTYGFLEANDFVAKVADFGRDAINRISTDDVSGAGVLQYAPTEVAQKFSLMHHDENLGVFDMKLVGKHNILNASAAIAIALSLGVDVEKIREGLKTFEGTARRFDILGEKDGVLYIDDYAHHPGEIQATLEACKMRFPDRRVVALFQPHTFTRTKALFSDFAQSFDNADKVFFLEIYGSAREVQGGVSSKDLMNEVNRFNRGKAFFVKDLEEAKEELVKILEPGDICIALGAGNGWEVVKKLYEQ